MSRLGTLLLGCSLALSAFSVHANTPLKPRIGILTDMSGTYSDISGKGSAVAAQMAVEDFAAQYPDVQADVVSGDHQNKTDVGMSLARDWIDNQGVDVIAELTTSSVALAAQRLTTDKDKLLLITGAGSSDLTGKSCTPNTIAWVYDTFATANGTGRAVVKQGGKTWFMLTVDYAFGEALERDAVDAVTSAGGTIVGSARHPLSTSDLSSQIFSAIASKAQIIGLAHAGGDLITAIKQAKEFGVAKAGQNLAALLIYISDVHAIGLDAAQGLYLTTGFYWDQNDESREWSKRFFERTQRMPTMAQAGVYSGVMHYLKAVQETGTKDTATVRKKMGDTRIHDMFTKDGYIRADGRMMHDLYLAQVKTPEESKYPWDYYNIVGTIPAEDAFRSVEKSECGLLAKAK
ncbi:ABC transporter substrate-binding protein [Pusillimonas sp. ANT_WB101]|uniref:ABC transporter substrate-binding protein n=1 Tax=Pusillimonas sp. ANT_WB101 TaxID=2597356 RepID=UPI0011ED6323|nr:ABC transporter substrate-binding protein [Pusillimonas sp. ANT_WB101]KAA0890950.1 ABC transporter substrate-binding protein [Pusillimonas sp. ANT_WB101]